MRKEKMRFSILLNEFKTRGIILMDQRSRRNTDKICMGEMKI